MTVSCISGISVNIPTKAFCPRCVFCCIDWVRWRLARGEDGRGWSTGGPQEIVHNECESSLFDHQSILVKDHFIGTAKIV